LVASSTPIVGSRPYSQWRYRFAIEAEQCVALVVGVIEGYALPHRALMYTADSVNLDSEVRQIAGFSPDPVGRTVVPMVDRAGAGAAMTLNWCEHQPREVEVVMVFRTIDGAQSARRADVTLQAQVLRASWSALGGPLNLPRPGLTATALARLAAETPEPLMQAENHPPEGFAVLTPGVTIEEGFAVLNPLSANTLATLYHMSARDSGVAVHPRVFAPTPDDMQLVTSTFALMANNGVAAEHDPIVDLGRNDFYRVLSVVGASGNQSDCETIAFARGEGIFVPRVYRYNPISRVKTLLLSPQNNNVVVDRFCKVEGMMSYIVNDTDQQRYRMTRLIQASAATVAPTDAPSRARHR
jgi:hypothetical protein